MSDLPDFDIYAELGITPGASDRAITQAYRFLAKRFHPDRGKGGDAGRFNRIEFAYKVLKNPQKLARYNQQHRTGATQARPRSKRPPSPPTSKWQPKTKAEFWDLLYGRIENGPTLTTVDLRNIDRLAADLGIAPEGFFTRPPGQATKSKPPPRKKPPRPPRKPPFVTEPEEVREMFLIGGQYVQRAQAGGHALNRGDYEMLSTFAHSLNMTLDDYLAEAKRVTEAADQPVS